MSGDPVAHAADGALRFGRFALRFDAGDGSLRDIALDDRVVADVYAAVRDRDWGTVPPTITVDERGAERIAFTATCAAREVAIRWRGVVRPVADGLVVEFAAEALAPSWISRVGCCVLHPSTLAGAPCRIGRGDGTAVDARFPTLIAPHQPFTDVASIAHDVHGDDGGAAVEIAFAGEVFETEDQRNWSDASFKTYGTPLALPFPRRLAAGERIVQRVTLRARAPLAASPIAVAPRRAAARALALDDLGAGAVGATAIGTVIASHGAALAAPTLARLRALGLAHLRVDLDGGDEVGRLARAEREAEAIGCALEVALHVDGDRARTARLADRLGALRVPIARILVLAAGERATPAAVFAAASPALRPLGAPLVVGTDHAFAELNRAPSPPRDAAGVCWSISPRVHADDDATVMGSVAAQADAVRSATALASGGDACATPVAFARRSNPDATDAAARGRCPIAARVDPRQAQPFGAAWALASIAACTGAGARSLTLFETDGALGLTMQGAGPSPDAFARRCHGALPAWHVLADLAEPVDAGAAGSSSVDRVAAGGSSARDDGPVGDGRAGWQPAPREAGRGPARGSRRAWLDPSLGIAALGPSDGVAGRLLIANLRPAARTIDLGAWTGCLVRMLDAATVEAACASPEEWRRSAWRPVDGSIELAAHAYACLARSR